ncbi:hypothetical protein M758_10G019800 [Ceratodon purpureus]|nr:hypothetical protein M758_10G019800 [Ceratodon purpureus]
MPMELAHMDQNFRNIFANGGELPLLGNKARRASCMSESCTEEEFDSSIWSNVPESVLYLVFSKLPLKSLIRIRSVSKLWMSTDFFLDGLQVRNTSRFALIKSGKHPLSCDQQELWVFDTPAQEWCKLSLGHFPSPLRFSGPFAVAGGLLCYISQSSSRGTLEVMVGNPLTRTWRVLPPNLALYEFPTLTHMFTATNSGDQYSITFVGLCDNTGAIVVEVYDSVSNSWRLTDSPPQLSSYYNFFKADEYLGLATIDRRSKTIKRLMYPAALQESSFLNRYEDKCWILESQGRMFMCSNAPRKEGLWQRLETEWSKVCPFPKVLKKYEKTALYLSDDVVLLVGSEPHCFPPQFEDVDPYTMVMFNKLTQQWSILPNVSASFGNVDELVKGLMFEPRFDAKP